MSLSPPPAPTPPLDPSWAPGWARWAFAGALGLGLWTGTAELFWAPLRPGGSTWAIKALPLLLALPGLWQARVRTARWVSLWIWLYVLEALVRGTTESGGSQVAAWGQLIGALLVFTACAGLARQKPSTLPFPPHTAATGTPPASTP